MRRAILFGFAGTFLMTGAAMANTPPPPPIPAGHKVIKPRLVFEGLEKHTDYVFFVRYVITGNGHNIEIKDSSVLELDFETGDKNPRVSVALLAIKRERFNKRKEEDPSLKWLSSDIWTLNAKVAPLETTAPADIKEVPVATFRVQFKEGVLEVRVESKKSGNERDTSLLPAWALGVIMSLSVTWLGIWFARRGPASQRR